MTPSVGTDRRTGEAAFLPGSPTSYSLVYLDELKRQIELRSNSRKARKGEGELWFFWKQAKKW